MYSPFISSSFDEGKLFLDNDLDIDKVIQINCSDSNSVKVECETPTVEVTYSAKKICDISSSLKFTLESQDSTDGIVYKDGTLSLTVPKELKNYKEGGKNLFDIIKEYFQKFCEKLGFKSETKIEHSLGSQLKVDNHGHLENVEPSPVHNNNRVVK
ncbi:hypothetical protein NOX90_02795 [Wolbachia endosymbiont of Anurida maritima]|uniref:hypothetical protein n=1 Tax=Wolbachia endosymbiont of Anurida maritima TaxID=2850562 RepID=UPI0035CF8530